MKKNSIIEECLKKSKYKLIKATTISTYVKSPFNVWADNFAPVSEKDPISDYLRMLFDQGNEHEADIVNQRYPGTKTLKFKTKIEGFKILANEMFKGTKVFYNMPLYYLPESFLAQPDIIEKETSHPSEFGDYHYIIKEIKLAKNIKKEHIMQACFANLILSKLQGYVANYVYIINRDNEEFQFSYHEYEQDLLDYIQDIREIMNGKYVSPNIGSVPYPWGSYAEKLAIKTKDLSLLNSVGSLKKKIFIDNGIKDLNDLASIHITKDLDSIKKDQLKKYQLAAKCFLEDSHHFIKKPFLKDKKIEIFLDFESSTGLELEEFTGDIDYLIGILKRTEEKEEYIPFIANSLEDEESMLLNFIEFLSKEKDFVIYHYGSYEIMRFKLLFDKYDVGEEEKNLILDNSIDLHKICKDCLILPRTSYSLKSIAPYLGFKWRLSEINAQQSLVLYMDYIKNNNKESLNKILIYNEDDLIATKIVKDFLNKAPNHI